jgi:hypothetical protein
VCRFENSREHTPVVESDEGKEKKLVVESFENKLKAQSVFM